MYKSDSMFWPSPLLLLSLALAAAYLLCGPQCGVAAQPVATDNGLNFKDDIAQLVPRSSEEVADLNARINAKKPLPSTEPGYQHRDELLLTSNSAENFSLQRNLKYDVEVLEPLDDTVRDGEDSEELEERYRGPGALRMNTDTFSSENIEVNDKDVSMVLVQQSHLVLTITLIAVALLSVALYAAFVIWRSRLEERYGMRELLVSTDDDFCSSEYRRHSSASDQTVLSRVA